LGFSGYIYFQFAEMKIFITSLGTRGDIEPFLSLGNILGQRGHDIVYCFPVQFRNYVDDNHTFYPITEEFLKLIDSREGSVFMGKANFLKKAKALFTLYRKGKIVNETIANEHLKALNIEKPDLIIQHPKCGMPYIWSIMKHVDIITYCPVPFVLHPVNDHPHIGFPYVENKFYIKLTYALSKYALVKQINDTKSHADFSNKISKRDIRQKSIGSKFIYAVSPQIFKRPDYWPDPIQVFGHHKRNLSSEYKPSEEVTDFLDHYDKVLFLSFGSMINDDPEKISEVFYKTIEELNLPCIVNMSSGGLVKHHDFAEKRNFLFVTDIPYDWLFKRIYAVIHHGGSGTTHMGIKHGLPTLIIPHILDQFMWNRLIFKKGFGPKGISINKVNVKKLKPLIKNLFFNGDYKITVENTAENMLKNRLESKLVDFIES
jgi:UDP:flavonoid glycosyltransferase YjiC (YdhE family)